MIEKNVLPNELPPVFFDIARKIQKKKKITWQDALNQVSQTYEWKEYQRGEEYKDWYKTLREEMVKARSTEEYKKMKYKRGAASRIAHKSQRWQEYKKKATSTPPAKQEIKAIQEIAKIEEKIEASTTPTPPTKQEIKAIQEIAKIEEKIEASTTPTPPTKQIAPIDEFFSQFQSLDLRDVEKGGIEFRLFKKTWERILDILNFPSDISRDVLIVVKNNKAIFFSDLNFDGRIFCCCVVNIAHTGNKKNGAISVPISELKYIMRLDHYITLEGNKIYDNQNSYLLKTNDHNMDFVSEILANKNTDKPIKINNRKLVEFYNATEFATEKVGKMRAIARYDLTSLRISLKPFSITSTDGKRISRLDENQLEDGEVGLIKSKHVGHFCNLENMEMYFSKEYLCALSRIQNSRGSELDIPFDCFLASKRRDNNFPNFKEILEQIDHEKDILIDKLFLLKVTNMKKFGNQDECLDFIIGKKSLKILRIVSSPSEETITYQEEYPTHPTEQRDWDLHIRFNPIYVRHFVHFLNHHGQRPRITLKFKDKNQFLVIKEKTKSGFFFTHILLPIKIGV